MLFRRSLRALLEAKGYEVVAEAGTGLEAVAEAERTAPQVVLMDVDMPELDGLSALRLILERQPEAQVVMLTGFADDDHLLEALEAGARGYLVKSVAPDRFFEMLEGVLAGRPALSPELAHSALVRLAAGDGPRRGRAVDGGGEGAAAGRPDPMRLTDRETEVLRLMVHGTTSSRQLGERLGVSERTVKFHVSNLLEKLQVGSRAEAVGFALRRGLIEAGANEPRF